MKTDVIECMEKECPSIMLLLQHLAGTGENYSHLIDYLWYLYNHVRFGRPLEGYELPTLWIAGPRGSGKTVFMTIINRLMPKQSVFLSCLDVRNPSILQELYYKCGYRLLLLDEMPLLFMAELAYNIKRYLHGNVQVIVASNTDLDKIEGNELDLMLPWCVTPGVIGSDPDGIDAGDCVIIDSEVKRFGDILCVVVPDEVGTPGDLPWLKKGGEE